LIVEASVSQKDFSNPVKNSGLKKQIILISFKKEL
jgi:hypothetical protein